MIDMPFTAPIPFRQAVQSRAVKRVLPMDLDSRDYARLAVALKERGVFSAKIENARVLDVINKAISRIVGGVRPTDEARRAAGDGPLLLDLPQAKLELRRVMESEGVRAEPGKEGTLQDPLSDRRIDLIVETNIQTAQGYGQWMSGQNPVTLDLWPAWELFRLIAPMGKERDWPRRWQTAGGKLVGGGRMVALKNDPIWENLGNPELFSDGINNPYPPFAFNSGMDVRDIDRDEAVALGLLGADDPGPAPQDRGFNDDLAVQADQFDAEIQKALAADPDLTMDGGVLRLRR